MRLTRRIDDGEVWTVLVLDFDDDLLRPKLLLPLQPRILILYVLLQPMCLTWRTGHTSNPSSSSVAGVAV